MKSSATGPRSSRGLSRAALVLCAVMGAGGFAICRRAPTARPAAHPAATGVSRDAAGATMPVARDSGSENAPAEEAAGDELASGPLVRALALALAYEARREADDPAGADAERLKFLELLNDDTAPRLVRALPPEFLETFFGDLALRLWAARDRAAAARWMAAHPAAHPVPAAALAHDWVTRDVRGLHAYLDALPAGDWKHLVAKSAAEEALVADRPGATLALLDKVSGEDARRDELREWAATKWALKEPEAAQAWAREIARANPEIGERLFAAVAIGRANSDPEAAASWLLAAARDRAAQASAIEAIARIWTARDPEAAARWAEGLPAGPLREAAEGGLLAVAAPEPERPER